MRKISLFGATGTIGDNTLDLIARHEDKFSLFAASAGGNVEKLAEIARRFAQAASALPPTVRLHFVDAYQHLNQTKGLLIHHTSNPC